MSNRPHINLIENQNIYMLKDAEYSETTETSSPASARDLFTHQTGQVLVEIGNMFINIPPFNDHVDSNTGNLLISIGNKLKARK
ncbi:MAG: hypothetical protein L0287_12850 [Anaerolineae bacterium]|nr:hypothetical protein [Anaerolineae bacterium]MCI0610089.1 hypothetical protein [Anaerolineae bacterium]